MTDALYLKDAYLARFPARVVESGPLGVLLDRTAFYPGGGGQPADTGVLASTDGAGPRRVLQVSKEDGAIVHRLAEGSAPLEVGAAVEGVVDWPRRHRLMRGHTALHILSGVVFRRLGSGITGGQISEGRARMDFSLPEFSRELAQELVDRVNDVVREDRPIHVRFLSREAFASDPSLVRVAPDLMPDVAEVRLIDIEGFDVQADGGTHVRSTAEVGAVVLDRIENKGARNKRLYLALAAGAPTLEG